MADYKKSFVFIPTVRGKSVAHVSGILYGGYSTVSVEGSLNEGPRDYRDSRTVLMPVAPSEEKKKLAFGILVTMVTRSLLMEDGSLPPAITKQIKKFVDETFTFE